MTRPTPAEKIADDTWSRLEQARTFDVRLGEETLTDILILDLKRHEAAYNVRVFQTTKPQEATSGTDLEVVVRAGLTSARRYAIQAKKLYSSGGYKYLNKKGNSGSLQLDILENYARGNGAIPYYMFYNSGVDPKACWYCCSDYDKSQFGCTLVPSRIVREAVKLGCRDFGSMHNQSKALPWRCLFDCVEWERGLSTRWAATGQQLALVGVILRYDWLNLEPIEGAWPAELSGDSSEAPGQIAELSGGSSGDPGRIADRYLENREPVYRPRRLLFIDKGSRIAAN